MTIDLRGKPIAITGASSGIGAATALACARAGMPVALGARRADRLNDVAGAIRALGGRAIVVPVDVTDSAQCADLIDACRAEFGSIYAVYANAGYGIEAPILEMSDSAVRDIFETNFFGTLNTLRPALPHFLKAGAGHALICSSCLGRMAVPCYSAYSATKAAQAHVGSAMRLELRGTGVHVSTVHPIGTRTEFFDKVKTLSRKAALIEHTSNFMMQTPEYVAKRTVACLRRPRAEVWTGLKGAYVRFGMSVCTLLPGVADFALRSVVSRRQSKKEPKVLTTENTASVEDRRN